MIRCTFAGHRDVCGVQAEDITEVLEEIIQYTESPIECFVGGMGKFDNLCAAAVRLLKRLRNRWMVEQADYVIAMVERKEGGAYATLQYAQKKKKKIINLAERKK